MKKPRIKVGALVRSTEYILLGVDHIDTKDWNTLVATCSRGDVLVVLDIHLSEKAPSYFDVKVTNGSVVGWSSENGFEVIAV